MGLADLILSAEDLPREPVATPEWPGTDGKLFVRAMAGQERRDIEVFFRPDEVNGPNKGDPRALLVGKTLVDEFGSRVFTDEQIAALAKKSGVVLDRLYDRAMRLSGVRSTVAEEEAAKKNSAPTIGGDSASA